MASDNSVLAPRSPAVSKRRDAVSALECLRYVSQHGLQEAAHGHWQTAAAGPQSLIRTSLPYMRGSHGLVLAVSHVLLLTGRRGF